MCTDCFRGIRNGWFLVIIVIFVACKSPGVTTAKSVPTFQQGMVVCSHPAAARAGLEVLKAGGNAFDAAIAVHFALGVVYPRAGNLGGGGFLVYRQYDGRSGTLDFRETAPAGASRDMYLNSAGEVINGMSLIGAQSAGVPGSVAGMYETHRRFGSLPWSDLIEPAIRLALYDNHLTKNEAAHLNAYSEVIDSVSGFKTAFGASSWSAGNHFSQPDLALTLQAIRDNGRDGFYRGWVAEKIIASMQKHGGLITASDLDRYRPVWRPAVVSSYKEYEIITVPPPSSGGLLIAQMLRAAEMINLTKYGHNTSGYLHGLTELARRTYAERAVLLGDPDFVAINTGYLLSDAYIRAKFTGFDPSKATPSSLVQAGSVESIESFETTHFSIVDPLGNAVGITTTLNGNYGAKLVVEDAGFLLNNEMDDFSMKPGVANQFGLVGSEANAIAPGKRMLSSMSPTIIAKDGVLYGVVGTPGGSTIITNVLQAILNITDFQMSMQEAVIAPKIHAQWLPDQLYIENRLSPSGVADTLRAMGHHVTEVGALGKLDCIKRRPDGTLEGGTDPAKGDGSVAAF